MSIVAYAALDPRLSEHTRNTEWANADGIKDQAKEACVHYYDQGDIKAYTDCVVETEAKLRKDKRADLLGKGLDALGGLFNRGDRGTTPAPSYTPPPKKNNTALYVTLGVLAVAGVATFIYFRNKNK